MSDDSFNGSRKGRMGPMRRMGRMAQVVSADRNSSGSAGVPARCGRRPAGHFRAPSALCTLALCLSLMAAPANFAAAAAKAVTNTAPMSPAPQLSEAERKALQDAKAAQAAAEAEQVRKAKIAAEGDSPPWLIDAIDEVRKAKIAAEEDARDAAVGVRTAFATPTTAAALANPAPASSDLLQFLDGAVLHGALKGVDAAHGLRWEHPAATTPFDLMPAHVDFVRFTQAKSLALAPSCHIRFANGDDLFGSVVSLDAGSLEFNTWFGGTMKVPRSAVQTITFLPKNYSLVYEGPADASEWVISGGTQNGGIRIIAGNGGAVVNGVVLNGGIVVMNPADATRGIASGLTNWTYRDGSFITAGAGVLGRNFNLSGSSTIEFDLACSGSFNLMISLYSPSLDRATYVNNKSLTLSLISGQISLLRTGRTPADQTLATTVTNFDPHGKPARVTLQCNEEEGSLAAQVDGVEVKRWTGLGSFSGFGTGFVVQNQPSGAVVKLSRIRVSKWEGRYEPDLAPGGATNADLVFFINRDKAGGKIESITGGKLNLIVGDKVLHIPAERVRQIDFAQSGAAAEPRGPWEVRAHFPGGGSVSFQLEKWDGQSIAGRSALFGALAFQPGSIREMEFNLDHPRVVPDASPSNPFDVLDQNRTDSDGSLELQYDALDQ